MDGDVKPQPPSLLTGLLLFMLAFLAPYSVQCQARAVGILINPRLPLAYLRFNHYGPRKPKDTEQRLWLSFVNNSTIPLELTVNGDPEDDYFMRYSIVPERRGGLLISHYGKPDPDPCEAKIAAMPVYNLIDVASTISIASGKEVSFSIPASHKDRCWHIELPFEFSAPSGPCCRPDDVGGEPITYLYYGVSYLPQKVQNDHY